MASFAGSAICPRCDKAVYAAEQVLGPGRKFYHKPCLSCTTCKKRLDSFGLLEHDEEPYCKTCHAKLFGTHNIGANRNPATPPRKSTNGTDSHNPSPSPATPLRRYGPDGALLLLDASGTPIDPASFGDPNASPETDGYPTLRNSSSMRSLRSAPSSEDLNTSRAKRPIAERYAAAAAVQRRHMTGDGTPEPKPIQRTLTGGSPSPRRYGGDNPTCARCNKTVYFAEQTKAVNKTYHKTCLRCTALLPPVTSKADPKECGALLDSRTLRDHDGEPMCAQCHRRMHGAAGLAR